jgi:DNA-binding NtrC family response regulator
LKKTRRIEITAFHRQVTIYSGDKHCVDATDLLPSRDESRPNIDVADRLTIDLGERRDASLDDARAGELPSLVEALLESGGKTSVAAQKLGVNRSSFYSKLRSLGLSITNVKTSLNLFREKRVKDES